MSMHMLLEAFKALCDAPFAWILVAGLALKTGQSIVMLIHCPLLRRRLIATPEQAEALVQRPRLHSPRFLVLTLLGIALSVGGLYTVGDPALGPFALAAIVIGAFILIVEPTQLSIGENELRVAAAAGRGAEAQELARDRLRWSHLERIGLETALTVAIAAVVAIY